MTKIKGTITQFGTKGYGFIIGDDGQKYFVHKKNIYHNDVLEEDTRVVFEARDSEKGQVAMNVKLAKSFFQQVPLSDAKIRVMFWFLLTMQLITGFYVFVAPLIQ